MKIIILSVLITSLIILGCDTEVSTGAISPVQEPTQVISQTMDEIDLTTPGISIGNIALEKYSIPIEYGLYTPELNGSDTVPLILSLHFSGGQGLPFLERFTHRGLGELDAIILSPTVPYGSDWTLTRTSDMLIELVELAKTHWPIDPNKIVITGYSMGGYGTWNLVDSNPELFSAAIPIAASPKEWLDTLSPQVPIFVIHPELDEFATLSQVESEVQTLKDKGIDIQLVVALSAEHYDTDLSVSYLYDAMDWLKYTVWAE